MSEYKCWKYRWFHVPTGKDGESELLTEMTIHQFLTCLAYWSGDDWWYAPSIQLGLLGQHDCQNVSRG